MKRTVLLICFLNIAIVADAADLSTASSQDLIAIYKQFRSLQAGKAASCENVELRRDSAKITFIAGRLTFSAPVAGRVFAAYYKGVGKFELEPPSDIDRRQIARFAGSPKLEDTFSEAVFYFTDDTYSELSKLVKIKPVPPGGKSPFASSQKHYAENFNKWNLGYFRGYPEMKNMPARMLADLTENSSKGFFLADFKGKKAGNLLFHISWNRDLLFVPNLAKGEEVMLLHVKPPNLYEWWSGFHLAAEYAKSRHPDHRELLAHSEATDIDLQVSNNNRISATAQMEYTVAEPARVLSLRLAAILRISSIEDESGNTLSFIQEDRKLDSDPWVILNQPAKPGERHKIKITYKEESTSDTRTVFQDGSGLFYVRDKDCWYPSFGSDEDRTRYEIHARSPEKFKYIATGIQTASEKQKDGLVTAWKSDIPLSNVGFQYGSFVEAERTGSDLKVTAYAATDLPSNMKAIESQRSVAQLQSMDRNVVDSSGIALAGFNPERNVKRVADLSLQALQFFQLYFGFLPFKAISVVEQAGYGTGSSPYLVLLSPNLLLDSTTQNSLHMLRSGVSRDYSTTGAVREMSRQWWEYLVGPKTYHDEWLSQGTGEFAASVYLRQFEPKELNDFHNIRRTYLLSKNRLGYRPVDAGPVWLGLQTYDFKPSARGIGIENASLVPYKGSYIMEMLRMLMYDPKLKDPDERFIAMLHDFTSTFAGKTASTEDFRSVVEKHTGVPMEWFFEQWIYGAYTPTYNFSYQLSDAGEGQTEVSATLAQSHVPESFHMELPVYVMLKGEPQYLGRVSITGTKPLKTSVKLPFRPEKVLLDPNHSILAEINQ